MALLGYVGNADFFLDLRVYYLKSGYYCFIANTLFEKLFNLGAFNDLFVYYDSFYAK